MRHVSSKCVGIYMCMISQDISGWLFILFICRYRKIFVVLRLCELVSVVWVLRVSAVLWVSGYVCMHY